MFPEKYQLIHLESVVSTNLQATDLLSVQSITSPAVILADNQTGGKGQGTNTWESAPGKNLLFSLVVFPSKLKGKEQFWLSKIAALSVCEMITAFTPGTRIKWPNDILVNKLKISGILIENTLKGEFIKSSVIGIGINVNQEVFGVPATSLKGIAGCEFDRMETLARFMEVFDRWYGVLSERKFNDIDEAYYQSLYGFNEWIRFSWGGVEFEALVEGVEDDGYLVLKARDNKILKFGFREVEFIL
jgi:BirA family transcriptional regulator, biotin operon repressor / biotin---[acetyl-CoA-carboxylase] ligase